MKMGYAEVDITPQKSVIMIGFNRDKNNSEGVLDSLIAQVAIWGDTELACMVTIDNIGFNKKDVDYLRLLISQNIGQSIEKVMVLFSHTHSAPNVSAERIYYHFLCEKICEAVCKAKNSMKIVSVGYTNAETYIGVNRRNDFEKVDRRVGILKVCDEKDDKIKLIILRVTAHANVLKRDNYLISSDFFGAVREIFGEKYECPVMIVQGSAGNVSPKYYCSNTTPIDAKGEEYVNTPTALKDLALELLNSVAEKFDDIIAYKEFNVSVYSKHTYIKSMVPKMMEALGIAKEAMDKCGINGEDWLKEVEILNKNGVSFQEEDLEVQYFAVGDWCLCGIPNETMTEFSIDLEKMLLNPFFYFNGYTNGCTSYFPTEEEYDIGGYEVYWAMLLYYKYYGRVYPYERDSFSKQKKFVAENYIL